jgi:DNA repair ATPase RecN
LFDQLEKTIEGYLSLREAGQHSEDYSDAIKELTSQTIIPLIERTNDQIESFKQMERALQELLNKTNISEESFKAIEEALNSCSGEELKAREESLNSFKATLNSYREAINSHGEAIESCLNFRNEYQTALEEIKELLISEEVESIVEKVEEELSPFSAPKPQDDEDELPEEKDSQEIYDNKQEEDNTPNQHFKDHSEENNNQKLDNEFPI